jgi:hypothetical protein
VRWRVQRGCGARTREDNVRVQRLPPADHPAAPGGAWGEASDDHGSAGEKKKTLVGWRRAFRVRGERACTHVAGDRRKRGRIVMDSITNLPANYTL